MRHQISEAAALVAELAAVMREADQVLLHETAFGQLWRLSPDPMEPAPGLTPADKAEAFISEQTRHWSLRQRQLIMDSDVRQLAQCSPNWVRYLWVVAEPTLNPALVQFINDQTGELSTTEKRLAAVALAYRCNLNSRDFDRSIPDDCAPEPGGMKSADAIGTLCFGAKPKGFEAPADAGRKWRDRLKRSDGRSDLTNSLLAMLPAARGRPRSRIN